MKTAIAIRHVYFEDLGTFEQPLAEAGYAIRYLDVGVDVLDAEALADAALLVVLGGRSACTRPTPIRSWLQKSS